MKSSISNQLNTPYGKKNIPIVVQILKEVLQQWSQKVLKDCLRDQYKSMVYTIQNIMEMEIARVFKELKMFMRIMES